MRNARYLAVLSVALSVAATGLSAAERPTERVTPAPEINAQAVIWRTFEPPTDAEAGDVWVNPKDGMEMVYIAPGACRLGVSDVGIEVRLAGYWIGRTEVTNGQYQRFVQATRHRAPDYWKGGQFPAGLESFPVVFTGWDDARAYAEWAGGWLPSELEWEKAARGGDGRRFPWGNWWDRKRCRNFELIKGKTYSTPEEGRSALLLWSLSHDLVREGPVAVGSYPGGASLYGCLDMAGNVSEWCADRYDGDAYEQYAKGDLRPPGRGDTRVLRGGSWGNVVPMDFSAAARSSARPALRRDHGIGFRCARGWR
jgi:formylglycine-generating enzyme required for sulfatase activity